MIRYRCPNCGVGLASETGLAGKEDRCPKCNAACPVPNPPESGSIRPYLYGAGAVVLCVCIGLAILWSKGKQAEEQQHAAPVVTPPPPVVTPGTRLVSSITPYHPFAYRMPRRFLILRGKPGEASKLDGRFANDNPFVPNFVVGEDKYRLLLAAGASPETGNAGRANTSRTILKIQARSLAIDVLKFSGEDAEVKAAAHRCLDLASDDDKPWPEVKAAVETLACMRRATNFRWARLSDAKKTPVMPDRDYRALLGEHNDEARLVLTWRFDAWDRSVEAYSFNKKLLGDAIMQQLGTLVYGSADLLDRADAYATVCAIWAMIDYNQRPDLGLTAAERSALNAPTASNLEARRLAAVKIRLFRELRETRMLRLPQQKDLLEKAKERLGRISISEEEKREIIAGLARYFLAVEMDADALRPFSAVSLAMLQGGDETRFVVEGIPGKDRVGRSILLVQSVGLPQ